jgi:hypothetical protein
LVPNFWICRNGTVSMSLALLARRWHHWQVVGMFFPPDNLRPYLLGLGLGPYTILIHFLINTLLNYGHMRLALLYKRSCNIRLYLIKLTIPYFLGYPVYPAIRKLRRKVMRL